jgi:hypothetical protein
MLQGLPKHGAGCGIQEDDGAVRLAVAARGGERPFRPSMKSATIAV